MKDLEFYNSIKLVAEHQGNIALININEFNYLQRIKGEYKWVPLRIENLPFIPVKINSFKEQFKVTKEIVSLRILPIWVFLSNNEQIVTPYIETLTFKKRTNAKPRFTLIKDMNINHHYLSNTPWMYLFDQPLAETTNAIEWNKPNKGFLFSIADNTLLQSYITDHKKELNEFNKIYNESAEITKELRSYQKRLN